MNGFQRRRELKMQSILQTAIELFSARGIKAVSIAEIAEKANVSQVSIYNFFGSKDDLAKQAIFTLTNEKMKRFEMLVNSNATFREKFEKMLLGNAQAADKYSEEFRQSIPLNDPIIRNFIEEYYQNQTIPLILKLIEQGKEEGCVNPDLATDAILLYLDMFKPLLTRTDISTSVRRDIRTLFFYGLFGKPWHEG